MVRQVVGRDKPIDVQWNDEGTRAELHIHFQGLALNLGLSNRSLEQCQSASKTKRLQKTNCLQCSLICLFH
jgi:hypothetical protein